MSVLIVGIAFKGEPETNDIRGSVSLEVFKFLKKKVNKIYAWDAVLSNERN